MVKATQAWLRNQRGIRGRLWLNRTSVGRVFAQRAVNAILVVIAHVIADQTAKVLFIHRDGMVEDLAAAASDPSFAVPFCQGAGMLVRFGSSPVAFKNAVTSALKIESRSRMT